MYLQAVLHTNAQDAHKYEEILFDFGAVSITFMDSADEPIFEPDLNTTPLWSQTKILALFYIAEMTAEEIANLKTQIQFLLQNTLTEYFLEELEEKNWEREWLKYFKPIQFGKRIWIIPSAYEEIDKNAINIHLDPGLAFGTGSHPTTALCLKWIDANEIKGKKVLDFGCGSGILALAAKLAGANKVSCIDIDKQALIATTDNMLRNNVNLDDINICLPEQLMENDFDIVLANILANPLISLNERIKSLVSQNGFLVLSGILEEQAQDVLNAYSDFDLQINKQENWLCLFGKRK